MIPESIHQVSWEEIELDQPNGNERTEKFVVEELVNLVPQSARIVTFDGFDGVGKSTLARHLAAKLDLPVLGLDNFLESQKGCFLKALKLDELSSKITGVLDLGGKVIIEGCLVEATLDEVGEVADFRIYVMRTSQMRSNPDIEFVDEHDILYSGKSTDQLITEAQYTARQGAKMPEKFGGGGSGELPNLERELIQYHCEKGPHNKANIIIKVVRKT